MLCSKKMMKKTPSTKSRKVTEMAERFVYRFDYSKAKPNRFASDMKGVHLVEVIDADVISVFTTKVKKEDAAKAKPAKRRNRLAQ